MAASEFQVILNGKGAFRTACFAAVDKACFSFALSPYTNTVTERRPHAPPCGPAAAAHALRDYNSQSPRRGAAAARAASADWCRWSVEYESLLVIGGGGGGGASRRLSRGGAGVAVIWLLGL